MPRAKSGCKIVTVVMPEGLALDMARLAVSLGRSLTAEVIHACERHVSQPPAVSVEVAALGPATPSPMVKVKPGPKPKKGRKE